jgi:hypothetical protein
MAKAIAGIVALFLTMGSFGPVMAGDWTAHGFLYKPNPGARGTVEKGRYDSGQDRVDARLNKEIWVGDPNYGTTIQDALTAISSNQAILRVPAGTHSISANLIVPSNITLKVERRATLAIPQGVILTINGGLEAGLYQIFSRTGTGKVQFGPGVVKEVLPQWFGAKGDGATDDSAAIQAMFDSIPLNTYYGWRVHFPNGIYYVASEVNLPGLVSDWDHGAMTTFSITGDGATLYTDQPISILKRWPPDAVDSPNRYSNTAFVVDGIIFKGTSLRKQVGLDLACTYGSKISNCRFDYLGRGLRLSYAMVAEISNCLTHNCVVSGFTGNAGYGMWNPTGATWHTNTCVYRSCRASSNGIVNHDIEGISRANPAIVTWTGHGLETGDIVFIDGITQDAHWSSLNKRRFRITKINDNSFSLQILNRTLTGANLNTSAGAGFDADYSSSDPGKIQWATWGWEEIDTFADVLQSCVTEGGGATDKIFIYSPGGLFNGFSAYDMHSENAAYGAEVYLNTAGAIYNFSNFGSLQTPITLDLFDMAYNARSTIRITNYFADLGTNKIRLPQDNHDYCNIAFDIKGLRAIGDDDGFGLNDPGYWYGGYPPESVFSETHSSWAATYAASRLIFQNWSGVYVKQDPNSLLHPGNSGYEGLRSQANAAGGGGVGAYDTDHGQAIMVKQKSSEITITASGTATQDVSNFIPAGVMVVGLTARVTTAIGGGVSLSVGETGSANLWLNAMGVTLNATGDLTKTTSTTPKIYPAATTVRLTSNGGNFNGTGKVRLTVHYISLEAPAS